MEKASKNYLRHLWKEKHSLEQRHQLIWMDRLSKFSLKSYLSHLTFFTWVQAGEQNGGGVGAAQLPIFPWAEADEPSGGGGRQVGRQPDTALPEPARAGQIAGMGWVKDFQFQLFCYGILM